MSHYPCFVNTIPIRLLVLNKTCSFFQAIKRDSSFASKVKRIVVLGGAFFVYGNVNPAAEANVIAGQTYSPLECFLIFQPSSHY